MSESTHEQEPLASSTNLTKAEIVDKLTRLYRESKQEPIRPTPRVFISILESKVQTLMKAIPGSREEGLRVTLKNLRNDKGFLQSLEEDLEGRHYPAALSKVMAYVSQFEQIYSLEYPLGVELLSASPLWGSLGRLYGDLWLAGEASPIQIKMAVNAPHLVPLPPFFDFSEGDPPGGFIDISHSQLSEHSFLRVPNQAALAYEGEGPTQDLFVRPCYRRLLEDITTATGHAIILGQPGTGKTYFLTYLLVERLRQGAPTVLQLAPDVIFSFTQRGAFICKPDTIFLNNPRSFDYFPDGAWFLTSTFEGTGSLSEMGTLMSRWLKVVQVSPSDPLHHLDWVRRLYPRILWLTACSWEEICAMAACRLPHMTSARWERLAYIYRKYGPNPRVCFTSVGNPEYACLQERMVRGAISRVPEAPAYPRVSISWTFDPEDHAIFSVRAPISTHETVLPASPFILQLLSEWARARSWSQNANKLEILYEKLDPVDELLPVGSYFLSIPVLEILSLRGDLIEGRRLGPGRISRRLRLKIIGTEALLRFSGTEALKELLSGCKNRGRIIVPTQLEYASVDALVVDEHEMVWLLQVVGELKAGIDTRALDALAGALPRGGSTNTWNFLFLVAHLGKGFGLQMIHGVGAKNWGGRALRQYAVGVDVKTFRVQSA